MVYVVCALTPCLSLGIMAIYGIVISKSKDRIKTFKLSKEGLEIRFDTDGVGSA